MVRYFIAQDVYGTWYALPEAERETFNTLLNKEDAYNYDAWDVIQQYVVDITKLTFENPVCNAR
jgi:hypothetical protein